MKNFKLSFLLLALAASLALAGHAQTPPPAAPADAPLDPGTVRSALDLVRADLKNEKAFIIAQNLPLTNDEAAEFWPLYNEYATALGALLDERVVLIREYVATHDQMTDAQATALATKVFALEGKRTALKRTWFKKFAGVVPAKKVAQFFQIENLLNSALDLTLMDSLPLIK